jgi:hypothetical protein
MLIERATLNLRSRFGDCHKSYSLNESETSDVGLLQGSLLLLILSHLTNANLAEILRVAFLDEYRLHRCPLYHFSVESMHLSRLVARQRREFAFCTLF